MPTGGKKNWTGLATIAAVAIILAKAVLITAGISVVLAALCAAPITFVLGALAAGELIDIVRSRRSPATMPAAVTAEA
jgi:hypothetical protein